jgi:hypothetical protein
VLDPGVADQQGQAAEFRYHRADQLVGPCRVGDVAREGRGGTTALPLASEGAR